MAWVYLDTSLSFLRTYLSVLKIIIVPIMVVPALYLIRNGLLTDFMNSTVDESQMLERIQKAINGHSQIPPPPATISSPTVAPPLTPQPSTSTPPSVISSPASPAEAVPTPTVTTHVVEPVSPAAPSSSSVSSTPSTPSTSSAPKVDKAEEYVPANRDSFSICVLMVNSS